MSRWFIYQLDLNKHQKLILYVLNDLGAYSEYISIPLSKLAEHVNMGRNAVNQNLKELHQLGMVTVIAGKGKAPNSYKLNINMGASE